MTNDEKPYRRASSDSPDGPIDAAEQESAKPDVRWEKPPRQRKRDSWIAGVGLAAGFVAFAGILTAGVVWWYAAQGYSFSFPAPAANPPSISAQPDPEPEPTPTETTPPPITGPVGAIGFDQVGRTSDGNFFTVTGMERVDGVAPDGTALGKVLRLNLAFSNVSAVPVDLTGSVVAATIGPDRAPLVPLTATGAAPLTIVVQPAGVVEATYFFAIDETQQTDMSVTVTYGAGEIVTFWGDAGLVFTGLAPAEPTVEPTPPVAGDPTTEPTDPTVSPAEPTDQPADPTVPQTEPTVPPAEPPVQPEDPTDPEPQPE